MSIIQAAQELLAEGPYAGVPFVKKGPVYQAGDLAKPGSKGGCEGDGVLVCEHPDAWSKISDVDGDFWVLDKKGGEGHFMNMHAAMRNKALRSRVVSWAVNGGWATQGRAWQASWEDGESGENLSSMHASMEELEEKHDLEDVDVKEVSALVAVPKLNDWWTSFASQDKIDQGMVEEMLFHLFARDQTEMDGTWWHGRSNTHYSPTARGAIFQDRLKNWSKKKIKWVDEKD